MDGLVEFLKKLDTRVTDLETMKANSDIPGAYQSIKTTRIGNVVYIGIAVLGSAEASAVWQAAKWDGDVYTLTWADGNQNYDNVASDLTALTYL